MCENDYSGWNVAISYCLLAKYLHELYPEAINIANEYGSCALHDLLMADHYGNEENFHELTRYFLLHDQGVVSAPDSAGWLALHLASNLLALSSLSTMPAQRHYTNETILKELLPWMLQEINDAELVAFLEAQLELERQARENVERDGNGQLPIHHVLRTS